MTKKTDAAAPAAEPLQPNTISLDPDIVATIELGEMAARADYLRNALLVAMQLRRNAEKQKPQNDAGNGS